MFPLMLPINVNDVAIGGSTDAIPGFDWIRAGRYLIVQHEDATSGHEIQIKRVADDGAISHIRTVSTSGAAPVGCTVSRDGRLFLWLQGTNLHICRLSGDFDTVQTVALGSAGTPTGVQIINNKIWTVDRVNDTVRVHDWDGTLINSWSIPAGNDATAARHESLNHLGGGLLAISDADAQIWKIVKLSDPSVLLTTVRPPSPLDGTTALSGEIINSGGIATFHFSNEDKFARSTRLFEYPKGAAVAWSESADYDADTIMQDLDPEVGEDGAAYYAHPDAGTGDNKFIADGAGAIAFRTALDQDRFLLTDSQSAESGYVESVTTPPTAGSNTITGLVMNYIDTQNFVFCFRRPNGDVVLSKLVSNSYTEITLVGYGTTRWPDESAKRMRLARNGTQYGVYVDGRQLLTATISDAVFSGMTLPVGVGVFIRNSAVTTHKDPRFVPLG